MDKNNSEDMQKWVRNTLIGCSVTGLITNGIILSNKNFSEKTSTTFKNKFAKMMVLVEKFKDEDPKNIITPTEEIKAIAKEINGKHQDFWDKVKIAVKKVKENIKYNAHDDIPRKVREVEEKREGDCNEMTYYTYSLLKEIGIDEKDGKIFFIEFYNAENYPSISHLALVIEKDREKFYIDPTNGTFKRFNKIIKKELLVRILNEREGLATYYHDMGETYIERSDFISAEFYLKKALNLNSNSPRIVNSLASLYLEVHKYREAYAMAKRAIDLEPKWVVPYINYMTAAAMTGKINKAQSAAKKASDLWPENPVLKDMAKSD